MTGKTEFGAVLWNNSSLIQIKEIDDFVVDLNFKEMLT